MGKLRFTGSTTPLRLYTGLREPLKAFGDVLSREHGHCLPDWLVCEEAVRAGLELKLGRPIPRSIDEPLSGERLGTDVVEAPVG